MSDAPSDPLRKLGYFKPKLTKPSSLSSVVVSRFKVETIFLRPIFTLADQENNAGPFTLPDAK